MPTRFFMPPDSSAVNLCSLPASPTARNRSAVRVASSTSVKPPRWTSGNAYVVLDRQEVEQRIVLEQHADTLPERAEPDLALADDRLAEHLDLAAIRLIEPADQLEQDALAGCGWPDEAELAAARDVERHAGQHLAPAETLVDIVDADRGRRGHFAALHASGASLGTYFESGSSLTRSAAAAHAPGWSPVCSSVIASSYSASSRKIESG